MEKQKLEDKIKEEVNRYIGDSMNGTIKGMAGMIYYDFSKLIKNLRELLKNRSPKEEEIIYGILRETAGFNRDEIEEYIKKNKVESFKNYYHKKIIEKRKKLLKLEGDTGRFLSAMKEAIIKNN